MAEEKLLTIRDVSLILGISEKEVIDRAEEGKIPAYKIAGVYLRFKRDQIEGIKKENFIVPSNIISFKDRFCDFLYFNDFYILSALIISAILSVIFIGR